jgi:hypothetical protein
MKKVITLFLLFSFLVGCESINNSPTRRVEEFFNKYQTLDEKLLNNLDYSIESNELNEHQKSLYREIMEKQYKDLIYVIKDEEIDGNTAVVKVEIEVYNYNLSNNEASEYLMNNQSEFLTEDGSVNQSKYIDYKLDLMKNNRERVKYTLELTLTKKEKIWIMDNISNVDREKIHGIYSN